MQGAEFSKGVLSSATACAKGVGARVLDRVGCVCTSVCNGLCMICEYVWCGVYVHMCAMNCVCEYVWCVVCVYTHMCVIVCGV